MAQRITDFEVISYNTTRLKVRSCTKRVPEISNSVTSICQQLSIIAEKFKKLTVTDMQSSDFIDMTNEIVNISNNTSDALKYSVTTLLNDAYERITKVSDASKAFADDLASASTVFGLALESISNVSGKVPNVSAVKTNENANVAPTPETADQETISPEAASQETEKPETDNQEAVNPEATTQETANPEIVSQETITPETTDQETTTPEAVSQETVAVENPSTPVSNESSGSAIAGEHSPGTFDNSYSAKSYNLSDEDYRELCATVYAEATEKESYCYSDSMGVTSTILNRVETEGFPDSVKGVISSGAFEGYSTENRKFNLAMNDPSVIPPQMLDAINKTLAGERNTDARYFAGNGEYNKFRVEF